MKVVLAIISGLVISFSGLAQENPPTKKKAYYGFNLGLNHSLSEIKASKPAIFSSSIENKPGFLLGLFMHYPAASYLTLAAKAEIAFYSCEVVHDPGNEKESLLPASLEVKPHFKFSHPNNEKLTIVDP